MAGAEALYTPEVLTLATSLAQFPLDPALEWRGGARSQLCGSTIELGLSCDAQGPILAVGLRVHACAIGQAAAAIFAGAARDRNRDDLAASLSELDAWLADAGPIPAWPGIEAIAAAQAYPARHGAIVLAWKAALDALPS